MEHSKNILVIDTGTSSMRGILFNETGVIVEKYQLKYSMTILGSMAVQDADDFEKSLINICMYMQKEALKNNLTIDGIALTSQRSSILPVDNAGLPLDAIMMWYDKRSQYICNDLNEKYRDEIYSTCGMKSTPVLSAPKIKWLKENSPEVYEKAYKILGIQDYLIFLLTGELMTDTTLASRTNLMDVKTCSWSSKMLDIYEIDINKLCELHTAGSVAGKVKKHFSDITGLTAGIPVVTAGGDQQSSAVGQMILKEGEIGITAGSGAYVVGLIDNPIFDAKQRVNLCVSAVPGKWIVEASCLASGTVFDWCKDLLFQEQCKVSLADDAISQSPCGANGVIMLPDLVGKGCPQWDMESRGCYLNLGLETKKKDFARAGLEGIAAGIFDCYEVLTKLLVKKNYAISSTGGLSKSPLFNQILADMLNQPIGKCTIEETTGIGAWAQAAVCLGWYSSLEDAMSMLNEERASYSPNSKNHEIYYKQNLVRNYVREQISYSRINQILK